APRSRHGDRRSRCRVGRPRDDDRPSRRSSSCRSIRPPRDRGGRMNPAELEILRTAFAFIPEEMGVALQRSAYSPNIKERMDASCALFDETGRMLSQAEHIPVHLGSMPASVEAVLHDFPGTLREGDQVAANELGARRLAVLAAKRGLSGLRSQADELLDYAERRVRAAVQSLPRGTWRAEDFLESAGSQSSKPIRICVEVTIGGSGVTVDFQGTDRQVVGNVNAPFAVTLSATYYVVRCITDPEAPRNAGAFRPVRVLADAGLLVHPRPPAAIAAGNVETSQRIVDVLFLALAAPLRDRVPAQSQGTMN